MVEIDFTKKSTPHTENHFEKSLTGFDLFISEHIEMIEGSTRFRVYKKNYGFGVREVRKQRGWESIGKRSVKPMET